MKIPHALSQIIRRSKSLSEILDSTVDLVATAMGMDVCSIYLLDPADHRLRLAATKGLDKAALGKVVLSLGEGITGIVVSEMRSIAVEDASSHPGYRYFPETREEQFHSYLGVPLAIRNRPVGAIVVQSRERRVFTQDEIETLNTIAAQLVGVVENARLVSSLDHPERFKHYMQELRSWNKEIGERAKDISGELVLKGIAASPGVAIGEAIYRGSYDLRYEALDEPFQDEKQEKERVAAAIEKTRGDILQIQEAAVKEADEEHALIFTSHLLLLNDPTLIERIESTIAAQLTAPRAVDRVFSGIESQLEGVNDVYLQERAEDIRDLRNRILSHLLEARLPSQSIAAKVVVAHGIPPSLVMELKAQGALGIVTERGGLTSHGALLARSMGIPAVTGVHSLINRIRSGDVVIVDGSKGAIIVRPTTENRLKFREQAQRLASERVRLQINRLKPAQSLDGVSIALLANVGIASEIHQAVDCGAEGIGLYRTEFPFLIREDFPTREEQVVIYRRACDAFPLGPVYFRVLDLGGDKFHPSMSMPEETNPVLGYRSLRMILDQEDLLKEQIQAFLRASQGRPIGILLPMVSSMNELERAKGVIQEAIDELEDNNILRDPPIGAMIEVPAAVEIAGDLAREVDFFSIGSNDLIQFTLAADRENARVAPFGDPCHPAVLRMIRRTIEAGHAAGIPVGLCGEMASSPEIAILLVAMGIDSLSLNPNGLLEIKEKIRQSEILKLRERVKEILALPDAEAIRAALRQPT